MPPDTTPADRRVTPERITALVQRYAALQELAGPARAARGEQPWAFSISIVPGLTHQGAPAWAVVDPDPTAKSARVMVRDIDATPIPGFDGDPMLEIRVTVAHELFHCVVAEAMAGGSELTIPAEEKIVETAAQAMVRSEGTPDARVMARAVRALPSALRARVAARAPARARGGSAMAMNIDTVKKLLDAIEAGDQSAMAEVCKQLVAEAASGGDAAPPSDPAPAVGDMAKVEPPKPAGAPGADVASPMDARRAKEMDMEQDKARARQRAEDDTLRADLRAIHAVTVPAAKEQIVVRLRARLGDAFRPASEKRIMDAPTFVKAQEIAAVIEETIGDGGGEQRRARSGLEPDGNPGPMRNTLPTVDNLRTEGFTESWLTGYAGALRNPDPSVAAAFLEQGRQSSRARVAPQGGK